MRSFCSLLSYRKAVPCGRMKKLHAQPPSCACSSEVFSRQQQEERGRRKKGEEELRGKEGRKREGGGKGRREKEVGQTDRLKLTIHLRCLPAGGVITGSSLSAIWRATLYSPTRPGGVLYRHAEISVRAHRERQLPSSYLLQLAICCHMSLFPGPLQPGSSHPTPDVRTGRLGVLSSLGAVLIWTGAFRFFKYAINRSFAGGSSAGSSARPRCLALDRS